MVRTARPLDMTLTHMDREVIKLTPPIHITAPASHPTVNQSKLLIRHTNPQDKINIKNQIIHGNFTCKTIQWKERKPPPGMMDTGANITATNQKNLIFNYTEFTNPHTVQTFEDTDTEGDELQALGHGYIRIESDQGSMMHWQTIYTPNSSGTCLSPDSYNEAVPCLDEMCIIMKRSQKPGTLAFHDKEGHLVESISLKRNNNGEWNTTNRMERTTHYCIKKAKVNKDLLMQQIEQEDNQLYPIKLQQKVPSVEIFKQISKNSEWEESQKKEYMNNDPMFYLQLENLH